jgi:hypothetical protein
VISEVFEVKNRDYVWDQGREIEIFFESKAESLDRV